MIAYSPVGRGWLTDKYRTLDDLPENDMRRHLPRFKPNAFDQNFKLVEAVEKMAKRKDLATSQVAIAWVARQGAIPIPGSTSANRIALNSKVEALMDEDMQELQKVMDDFPIAGERYGGVHEKFLNA